MQKIRTMRTSGSRILKDRQLTIGLDLGDRWSSYCVMDEEGNILDLHRPASENGFPECGPPSRMLPKIDRSRLAGFEWDFVYFEVGWRGFGTAFAR